MSRFQAYLEPADAPYPDDPCTFCGADMYGDPDDWEMTDETAKCPECVALPVANLCSECGEFRGDPVLVEFVERWQSSHLIHTYGYPVQRRDYPAYRMVDSCDVCEVGR